MLALYQASISRQLACAIYPVFVLETNRHFPMPKSIEGVMPLKELEEIPISQPDVQQEGTTQGHTPSQ
jgi:hypothetical protein